MRATKFQSGRVLSAGDIYPAVAACPICGCSTPRRPVALIQRDPEIVLLACPRCLGQSASHMPTPAALDRYYGSYYDHCERERVTFHKPARLARRIARAIPTPRGGGSHSRGNDFRILDFGGGDGTIGVLTAQILALHSRARVHVQVVDYVHGRPARNGRVDVAFVDELGEAAGGCDLVIASGVLEHVPALDLVFPELVGKLRPGGHLYARTPYMLPFMRHAGMDMTYPGHVHDLGDAFWGMLRQWFPVPLETVVGRPSIVQSGLRAEPVPTLAAYALKFPARVESLWTRHPRVKVYGGWEVVLRRSHDRKNLGAGVETGGRAFDAWVRPGRPGDDSEV